MPGSAVTHVTYFANDLADAAVARRVHMLQVGGARVTVIGFRRTEQPVLQVSGAEAIDLGRTFDARFLDRAMKILRRSMAARRWKDLVSRSDVLLARNIEMAVLADCARVWSGANVRLVYECLDIHGLLLASSPPSVLLRWWERRLLRRCAALVVSSPGFITNYFERLGVPLPTVVVSENKRLTPIDPQRPAHDKTRDRAPWRMGWFGNIRCVRSFYILKDLARRHPDLIEVELRGRPTGQLQALIAEHLPLQNMRFSGPYAQSELASIYERCHLAWAMDFWQQGQNSDWLLPNRIYEGGFYNCPPIALAGTETARWLTDRAAGVVLQNPEDELETFLTTLTTARYAELKRTVAAIPTRDLVHTVEECERFAKLLVGRAFPVAK